MRVRVLVGAVVLFAIQTTLRGAEPSQSIELADLAPWTNPFSEHPLFKVVVQRWKVGVDEDGDERRLTLETVLSRSTDHPFSLGAVYSAAPGVAPSVLRALAQRAGAHIYVQQDAVVYANRSLLSVTVVDAGRRTIRLPRPMTLEDGFTGQTLARQATEVELEFKERESKLLLLTP